jgi:hypothetical protein
MLRHLTRTLICKPSLVSRRSMSSISGIPIGRIGQKSVSTSARQQSKRQSSTSGTRSWKERISVRFFRLGFPLIGLSLAGYITWRCHLTAPRSIAKGQVDEIRRFLLPSEANAEEVKDMSNAERVADILDETKKIMAKFPNTVGEVSSYIRLCHELHRVLVDNMIRAVMIDHILLGVNHPGLSGSLFRMVPGGYFITSVEDHETIIRKNLETIHELNEDMVKAFGSAMMAASSESANELQSWLVQSFKELNILMKESNYDSHMAQWRCAARLSHD